MVSVLCIAERKGCCAAVQMPLLPSRTLQDVRDGVRSWPRRSRTDASAPAPRAVSAVAGPRKLGQIAVVMLTGKRAGVSFHTHKSYAAARTHRCFMHVGDGPSHTTLDFRCYRCGDHARIGVKPDAMFSRSLVKFRCFRSGSDLHRSAIRPWLLLLSIIVEKANRRDAKAQRFAKTTDT